MKGNRRLWAATAVVALGVLGLWFLRSRSNPSSPVPSADRQKTSSAAVAANAPDTPDVGALSGSVRARDGKAVKNAHVCATTVRSEVSWTPDPACATTDEQGGYRIAPLGSALYVVSATARGFQPASALRGKGVFLAPGEAKTGVDISLDAGGAQLTGQVIDATGGPISGATIRVLRRATPHDTTVTRSDPDGSFSVWMAAAAVTVLADAPGYAPVRIAHIVPSHDLVLKLTPESIVRGRVIAAGTGAPVEGVRVRAIRPGSWNDPTQPSATSQADGAFEVRGLEPGSYTLVGERAGWRGESGTPVEVALASQVEGLTLTVSTATVVTGKVVQRGTSEPCSRGKVMLGPASGGPAIANAGRPAGPSVPMIATTIEADGAARFTAVPAGSYRVDVQCADFRLVEGPTTLEVGEKNIDGILWKVDPGVRVLVRALDQAEQPVANASFVLRQGPPKDGAATSGERPRPPVRGFTTTVDGTFEVKGLAPGQYTLEENLQNGTKPVLVDARAGDKIEATIHLQGRARILVTVRSPEGVGVDQVQVTATPATEDDASPSRNAAPTAAGAALPKATFSAGSFRGTGIGDGRFEIGPLVSGVYHVAVSDGINPSREPSDWPRGDVVVHEGVVRATVVLRRGGAVSGRVVDGSGQALPDVWVTADCRAAAGERRQGGFSLIASRPGTSSRAVTDQDGRFRLERIAEEAQCVLRAEQSGTGGVGVAKGVRAGRDTVITVQAPASLSGTAILPDGTPVTSFQLSVRNPDGQRRSETLTAINGRWSLSRVLPGRIHLAALDSAHDIAEASLDLAPGEQHDGVALQFQPPHGDPVGLGLPRP